MDTPNLAFQKAVATLAKSNLLGSTPTTPKVHLAKAAFTPGPNLVIGDITEADFTGYSAKAISSWGSTHADSTNQALFEAGTVASWTPTDAVAPNTIYGWVLVDSTANVVASGLFDPPRPMNSTANTIDLVVGLAIAPWRYSAVLLP